MALKRNCNFFFLKKKTRKKEDQQKFWNCRKLRMTSKNLKPVNGKRSGRYPSRRREISSRQWEGEKGVTFIRSKMFYFITRKWCSFCFWILFKRCVIGLKFLLKKSVLIHCDATVGINRRTGISVRKFSEREWVS